MVRSAHTPRLSSVSIAQILLCIAFLVLAIDPLLWLFRSWSAPGYDSPGAIVFGLVAALFFWSAQSPITSVRSLSEGQMRGTVLPVVLLFVSFLVRLASQLLAINLLGALMLVIDVFAFAVLARLADRGRPVSPLMLAGLFCFALPLEPMLQRTLGFALQQVSADASCMVLKNLYASVSCSGTRIRLQDTDLLVDLPCSGARVMVLLLTAYCFLAALKPMSTARMISGFAVTLVIALLVNTLRICLLAIGLHKQTSTGIDVMLDPWHSGIGLGVTALGVLILLLWLHSQPETQRKDLRTGPESLDRSAQSLWKALLSTRHARGMRGLVTSSLLLSAACLLVLVKPQPLDVSAALNTLELPLSLGGYPRKELPLSSQERDYFSAYGGVAARAGYGSSSLLLVQTTSPLRHLHAPDVCFSASGYEVSYVGVDFSGGPVAIYRSRSSKGEDLRVRVRYVSSSGFVTHSISEVVWHWARQPEQVWTMVQTVSPWTATSTEFLASVGRSLNLFSVES